VALWLGPPLYPSRPGAPLLHAADEQHVDECDAVAAGLLAARPFVTAAGAGVGESGRRGDNDAGRRGWSGHGTCGWLGLFAGFAWAWGVVGVRHLRHLPFLVLGFLLVG
jgi:hypothetical protein